MFDSKTFLQELGIDEGEEEKTNAGNSKIYRFSYDRKKLVLKVYKGDDARIKSARSREISAYEFLNTNNFKGISRLHTQFEISDGIILDYIPGWHPCHGAKTNDVILKCMFNLKQLFLRSPNLFDATDACFSTDDVLSQIFVRIKSLQKIEPHLSHKLHRGLQSLQNIEAIRFPDKTLTFSLSDVGPHNILKYFKNYFFLDLEFFGRDSSVKAIADYLLHPKNRFPFIVKQNTFNFGESRLETDIELLTKTLPFFAVKWACIVARRTAINADKKQKLSLVKLLDYYLHVGSLRDPKAIYEQIAFVR
jgi:hypothetical protein